MVVLMVIANPTWAQEREPGGGGFPERVDSLSVTGPGPFLVRPWLSLPLVDLRVNGQSVPEDQVLIDPLDGLLTFPGIAPDSVLLIVVRYRYAPITLARQWVAWPQAEDSLQQGRTVLPVDPGGQRLVTRGSISRGVSAGSGRDARVESGLRLQVSGELAPGIRLDAALTDEDTPLVPEGVTRQLDQFDRIRIGVEGRLGRVELGDYDARLGGTRYARLNRRLQGAGLSSSMLGMPFGAVRVTGGAAVSRGIFRSMALPVLDGIQGPYRLTGEGGERFILIIPGTERVYLNGERLEPGADADYVLDHATAELTFSARRMIRSGQRISVEFEYTTQRFSRTMSFAEATGTWQTGAGKPLASWSVAAIREADGDAFADELGLSSADSLAIATSAGGAVRVDGATVVPFDPEAAFTQYFREATDAEGFIYREVDRTPAQGEPVYRVVFSWVGAGQGAYERVAGVSGNVAYRFRGPGLGAYLPERTLPVPVRRNLSAVRIESSAMPFLGIRAEWAYSSIDQNRLSDAAGTLQTAHAWDIGAASRSVTLREDWSLGLEGNLSGRGAAFETFERVRDVDFLRQWNLPIAASNTTGALIPGEGERQGRALARVIGPDSTGLDASWQRLRLGAAIEAERFDGRLRLAPFPALKVRASGQHVHSAGTYPEVFSSNRRFMDARVAWEPQSFRWSPWAEWEHERFSGTDPASSATLGLERRIPVDALRFGLDRTEGRWTAGFQMEERREKAWAASRLTPNTYHTLQGQLAWQPSSDWRSVLVGGWRSRQSRSSAGMDAGRADRSIILSWLGQGTPARGHRLRWNYDVRAEQTAAQQEIYLRTGPDRGEFVWVDGNGDGVIQEDEFLPESLPGEGEYARVLFPTDSLESVTTAAASLGYEYAPQRNTPAWMRFSMRSQLEVSETSRSADRTSIALLQPDVLRSPGQTVNGRFRFSQQLGLAPLNPRRDADLSMIRLRSMAELASGVQVSRLDEYQMRWREAVSERWDLTGQARHAVDESSSTRYASRTYRIRRVEWQPGVVFKPGKWKLQGRWVRGTASETASGTRASVHRIPLDVLFGASRWSWRAGLEWASTVVRGGQAVGLQLFELTEGRGVGTSWLWNVRLDARITEVVTATLRYDGRNPEGLPSIHTGSFQLAARF